MAKDSRKCDNRPSWQFYPDDWLAEASLRLCDLSARGLWIDVLCQLFKMEERGKLRVLGSRIESRELAAMVGRPEAEVKQALDQLIRYGVCETDDNGCIYSRRMVREESIRQSKIEAGRKGGQASKTQAKTEAKRGSPTPSSSPAPLKQGEEEEERPPIAAAALTGENAAALAPSTDTPPQSVAPRPDELYYDGKPTNQPEMIRQARAKVRAEVEAGTNKPMGFAPDVIKESTGQPEAIRKARAKLAEETAAKELGRGRTP